LYVKIYKYIYFILFYLFDKRLHNDQQYTILQIFIKLYLRNVAWHFVDKLVLRCVVVCIYFRATGPIGVTYSKRRARSEWKLYQVRLRCVKGARIPISKDRLPIDVEATVYISSLRRTENGYAIPLRLGVLLLHFYVKRYTDQSRYCNINNKKHASINRPVLFLTRPKQCNVTCQR